MWWVRTKHQFRIKDASQDRQPKIQSSLVREISSKNYGADQQRLQISDLHFDKFPTPATFACWKIRFKTEVCTCSQFPTEAMSVDQRSGVGWFSGWFKIFVLCQRNSHARFWSTRCEILLQHWTKSSIIPNQSGGKKGGSVSFEEDRSLTWSTRTSGSLEPIIPSRIMPTY